VLYAGGALGLARCAPVTVAALAPYAALDLLKVAVAASAVPAVRRVVGR
jgi:hypothetical protein